MKKKFEIGLFVAFSLIILYILISFIEVNMYNIDAPEKISAINFFKVFVKLGGF